jgi:actin-related protein 8
MFQCILVVGGGMKFSGIGKWLQNRVALQIPYMYRSETLDIVTSPKEMDPAMTVWKGAAVMSCLESAPELWVTSAEWQKYGVRVLREKAPFIW